MADTFDFKLITPTGIVYEGRVEQATMIGALGEFAVLAMHTDFITSLLPGVLTLKGSDGMTEYLLSGGLAEVKDGAMTVLADDATPPTAVDSAAAAAEVTAAEAKLAQMSTFAPDYDAAMQALLLARSRANINQLRRASH
jgi:F-type H+-transporting ATPase subunit epsilon